MPDMLETLRKYALVTRIDLLVEHDEAARDGEAQPAAGEEIGPCAQIDCLGGVPFDNPIMVSQALRDKLRAGAADRDYPFIIKDAFEVYFACIRAEGLYCYLGPLSVVRQDKTAERRFYMHYGIDPADVRSLRFFTLQEILYIVELADQILNQRVYEETELLFRNKLTTLDRMVQEREQAIFLLHEEDENEDDSTWRHTYREERHFMDAVREGRTEDALRLSRLMDDDSGRLARGELSHWRNLAIVAIALVSRAAIEGGISPEAAYRISGYYIQKCDVAVSATQLMGLRDYCIRELTDRVHEKLTRNRTSTYTEGAKRYIARHYREKIRLEEMAETLGISPAYLSRLFRKETGVLLQDYVISVRIDRASNLLRYSDQSLSEIAEYVGFPSQSYFGKIFKKEMHMTPKAYRDRYKASEWRQG